MSATCSTHWETINSYKILVEKLKETDYFEELGNNWRIILKRNSRRRTLPAFNWLSIGSSGRVL
jgi:hypothetical protein